MKTIIRISTIIFLALTLFSACKSDQDKLEEELWNILPNGGTAIYDATLFTIQKGNQTPQDGYTASRSDGVLFQIIKNYPLVFDIQRRAKGSINFERAVKLTVDFSDFSKNGDTYVSKWVKAEDDTTVDGSNEGQIIISNYGSYIKVSFTQIAINQGIPYTLRMDFKSRRI